MTIGKLTPDITGIVELRLTNGMKPNLAFPGGYMTLRREGKDKRGESLALLVKGNLKVLRITDG